MDFFFYGTLLDHDVRRLVLPHLHEELVLEAGELVGFKRVKASHGHFPVLLRKLGGRVSGLHVRGMDWPGLYRMAHFEGLGYELEKHQVQLESGSNAKAWVFVPTDARFASRLSWDPQSWTRQRKRRLLYQIPKWMSEYGAKGPYSWDQAWHARRQIIQLGSGLRNQGAFRKSGR